MQSENDTIFSRDEKSAAIAIEATIRTKSLLELSDSIKLQNSFSADLEKIYNTVRFSVDVESCILVLFVNGMWWAYFSVVREHKFINESEWQKVDENESARINLLFDMGQDINQSSSVISDESAYIGEVLVQDNIHFERFRSEHGGVIFKPSADETYSIYDKAYLNNVAGFFSFCVDKNISSQHLDGIYLNLKAIVAQFNKDTNEYLANDGTPIIYQDPETGLYNKQGFLKIIMHLVSMELKDSFVVIFSISETDNISSLFDENVYKCFLNSAIENINNILTEKNRLSYLGSGEFAFVMLECDQSDTIQAINNIKDKFKQDLLIEGHRVRCDPRVGYSCYPSCGTEPEELLKKASIALYQAKSSSSDRVLGFSDSIVQELQLNLELAQYLPEAIENDEFILNFQPIVSLQERSKKAKYYEALIRWEHPEKGLIQPNTFIKLAEESGDIIQLGYWVVNQICTYLSSPSVPDDITVSINLSPVQLREVDIVDKTNAILQRYNIPSDKINFEITETLAMLDSELSKERFSEFHAAGFKLSVDDFGTGYSSLSYLLDFSFDILKVDKSFIDNTLVNEGYATIGRTMVELAHELSLTVVCEGIETESQLNMVSEWQADMIQGYLISKPKPWRDFFPDK